MSIPTAVMSILDSIGQAATEVPCPVEGCREFVSVAKASAFSIPNFQQRFPYFAYCEWIFHAYRFRVRSELIEADTNVSPDDLWDYQTIFVADESILEQILSMWLDSLDQLGRPADCDIPI